MFEAIAVGMKRAEVEQLGQDGPRVMTEVVVIDIQRVKVGKTHKMRDIFESQLGALKR